MSEPLVVHLNRDALHDVVSDTGRYRADGDFEVVLRNHGSAVHVHLKLEGPLAHVAALEEPNYYVETDSVTRVPVAVDDDPAPVEGWLEVVSGYGSESEQVTVSFGDDDPDHTVEVDERLADPPGEGDESLAETFTREDNVRVVGFAAAAVVLALVALVVAPSLTVGFGVAVVLAGAVVATYLLLE